MHYEEYSYDFLSFTSNMIEDMLYFELRLSRDLISEIMEDYKQFIEKHEIGDLSNKHFRLSKLISIESLNETTTRYVDYDL